MSKKKRKYNQLLGRCKNDSLEYCINKHFKNDITTEEWKYIKRCRNRSNLFLERYFSGKVKIYKRRGKRYVSIQEKKKLLKRN